jgi:asparagine synthase (glutamine-hydrolysing)
MPGLVGIFDPEASPDKLAKLLNHMSNIITHESWYKTDLYVQPPVAVGRVNLGIVNPEPQPAMNEDGSVLVWMDGEIYHFQRLSLTRKLQNTGHKIRGNSDAELIAHLYEDLGEACLKNLNATFALAIYDLRVKKLIIAVDRAASRPLFYFTNKERFLFASEMKAILQDKRISRKVDEQGAIELFTFRHLLADHTLLKDIHFLPAGHLVVFQPEQSQVRPYWVPNIVEDASPVPFEVYVEEVVTALRRSLEQQLYGERPVGEFLSGGLDSRALAAALPPFNGRFHTFSRGPQDCWDVQFGAMVAERIGSQHHHLDLSPDYLLKVGRKGVWLTEGLMTVNDFYMLGIIDQVKPYVDFVFLGIGTASGPLAGIEIDDDFLEAKSVDEVAEKFVVKKGVYIPQLMQAWLFSQPFYHSTRGVVLDGLRTELNQYDCHTPQGLIETFWLQCRRPRSANWGAFLSRSQVETRYPYNDNQLADLVLRIPPKMRMNRQMQIAVIKRARPDLAKIPWDYTGLPASRSTPRMILMRRIYFRVRREFENLTGGLVPAVRARDRANYPLWYRTVLRTWLEEILLDKRTAERGYYDGQGIRQLIDEHMSGRYNRSLQFGLLLAFELWNRLFIDGETP